MYNKRKFNKINDKKVLHKVKKQWVTISLALLMMIGGSAVATHINASANSTNDQSQQVSVKLGSKGNKNTIINKAKALHQNLLSKASMNKSTNKAHKQINTTHQGDLITVNNKPVKKVSNINKIRMHKANLYHGFVYNHINKPFQNLKINQTLALHSSIDFDNSRIFGYLRPGNIVKANRMFKQYGHYSNYLRYEINLANKHTAFITGNNHFVSYVIPTKSYKYYQNKTNKLIYKANYKNAKKISKQLHKLNKQRSRNFNRYANLYEMAFNAQQRTKYPVTVDYNNKRHIVINTNITPVSNATSTSSSSMPSYNYVPTILSYVAPVSYNSSAVMPSSSTTTNSSSASTKSMSSIASSVNSSASKSTNSISSNSSVESKASSSSNQSTIRSGIYNGLKYIYVPNNKSVEFTNGELNWNSGKGSFLFNDSVPSDITNANTIKFDNNIKVNSSLSDMNNMLAEDANLQSLDLGNGFNTSRVTNMGNLFRSDDNLHYLNLGNNFNTANVSDMNNMFYNVSNLKSLFLPALFNTKDALNNSNMNNMFYGDSDLSTLNISSLNTIFNNSNNFGISSDQQMIWTSPNNTSSVNLIDGKSHLGTWTYTPNKNNSSSTNNIPADIHIQQVRNDIVKDVNQIIASKLQSSIPTTNAVQLGAVHGMLGASSKAIVSNILHDDTTYEQLAQEIANQSSSSWSESDLTLNPQNITGPEDENSSDINDKTYSNDDYNKRSLRVDENRSHLIKINGIGVYFMGNLSDMTNSDFHSDYIQDSGSDSDNNLPDNRRRMSTSNPDPDYLGMHTIVKYTAGGITAGNTASDTANAIVKAFNLGSMSLSQAKRAKELGLGFKYRGNKLYSVLVLGPNITSNTNNLIQETKLISTHHLPTYNFVKTLGNDFTTVFNALNNILNEGKGNLFKGAKTHIEELHKDYDLISKYGIDHMIHDMHVGIVSILQNHALDNLTKFKSLCSQDIPAFKLFFDTCKAGGLDTGQLIDDDGSIYEFLKKKFYNPSYWTFNEYLNSYSKVKIFSDTLPDTGDLLDLPSKNEMIIPMNMIKQIIKLGIKYDKVLSNVTANVGTDVAEDVLGGVTDGISNIVTDIPGVSDLINWAETTVIKKGVSDIDGFVNNLFKSLSENYYENNNVSDSANSLHDVLGSIPTSIVNPLATLYGSYKAYNIMKSFIPKSYSEYENILNKYNVVKDKEYANAHK